MPERADKQPNFVIIIFILLGRKAEIRRAGGFGNRGEGLCNSTGIGLSSFSYSIPSTTKQTMIRTEQILGLKELCRYLYFFS